MGGRLAENEQRAKVIAMAKNTVCPDVTVKWDSPGWNIDDMDWDSKLRISQMQCLPHHKLQLPKRVYTAVPALNKGRSNDQAQELKAWTGMDTSWIKDCSWDMAETDYNRWDPGYCPVGVNHIVMPVPAIGANSRDITRSNMFRKTVGQSWCRNKKGLPWKDKLQIVGGYPSAFEH